MSLFIATGSNLGDRKSHLDEARNILSKKFKLIAASRIYESPAVDYLNQPDFYNQVLEFEIPDIDPLLAMDFLLETEQLMGRKRGIPKGPRVIDLDILFWGESVSNNELLILPHPRVFERSFVVLPLSELPGFKALSNTFSFTFSFNNSCSPIS